MTGREFQGIRRRNGLSIVQWGLLIGYQGNDRTINKQIRDYEGRDAVPEHIGRLAYLLDARGVDWLPSEWLRGAGIRL